ncbi:Proline utilization protein [Pleurostoma richardsiae]|uniref:Proline utilization protein n=1 Tax=Pleurostoma richardsiae TaxID=41990 RepID=A0AA38RRF3_9PEZI|nr:Proline utilization protein [Pleurostoma richardsiae]
MAASDFSVLSDQDVKALFTNFTSDDVSRMASELESAFLSYSVGGQSAYQVHRQGVTRPDGQTTLFMPATLPSGVSVKIVGVPPPRPASAPGPPPPLRGVLVLCDAEGRCVGVVNSEEFTAFRTALGAMLLYRRRRRTEHLVVFGAGKQALWHARLALVLRGADIKTVTVVNRSAPRARQLVERLRQMDLEGPSAVAAGVEFVILEPAGPRAGGEGQERLRSAVTRADAIFCTTPSTAPLFPAEWLTGEEARHKTRYVSAIGSYKLDMRELDPELLRAAASTDLCTYSPHEGAVDGVIAVDSREACALEAGEVVDAELPPSAIVEAGELVNIWRTAGKEAVDRLDAWVSDGFVIYKSVGVGIMDLSLGKVLLDLAREKGVGYRQAQF